MTLKLLMLNSIKIDFSKKTNYGLVGFATEYFSTGQTVISIGYISGLLRVSKKNFRLSLPVLVIDSVLPAIVFGLVYFFGAFFLKKKKEVSYRAKTEQDRINELRLIEDRAN